MRGAGAGEDAGAGVGLVAGGAGAGVGLVAGCTAGVGDVEVFEGQVFEGQVFDAVAGQAGDDSGEDIMPER